MVYFERKWAYYARKREVPKRYPENGLVFHHPLGEWSATAATGQTMTYAGSAETSVLPTATTYKGISCCLFNANSLWRATTNVKEQNAAYKGALSCWVACKNTLTTSYAIGQIAVIRNGNTGQYYYGLWKNSSPARIRAGKKGSASYYSYDSIPNNTNWHHVVVMLDCAAGWTYTDWTDIVYVDGTKVREATDSVANYGLTRLFIGNSNTSTTNGIYLAGVRLYNRLLTPNEIRILSTEYTPATTVGLSLASSPGGTSSAGGIYDDSGIYGDEMR